MSGMRFDAIVLGAGAAGLLCAAQAGQRGLRVLLIDHAAKVAEKIRISGGGRCNFTNRNLDVRAPQRHYVGRNPQFVRSALARYTQQDFIALLERHGDGFESQLRVPNSQFFQRAVRRWSGEPPPPAADGGDRRSADGNR